MDDESYGPRDGSLRAGAEGYEPKSGSLRAGSEEKQRVRSAALERSGNRSTTYSPNADRIPSGPLTTRSVDEAANGSMVQDLSDLKRLGDEMERVKTGSELLEEGLVPDPIQDQD